MHGAFDSHLNRIFIVGSRVLNLTLPGLGAIDFALGHVNDPDVIVKAAETDAITARGLLLEQVVPTPIVPHDWPDLLAADLLEDPNRRLEDWANEHDLALETLSRGFSRAFGITPVLFRSEARARKAFEQIVEGTEVLSKVLEASGFADQAHMSRAIRSLTGATPKSWLRRASFKSPLSAS
jgi:AraC-like DNA-binding protein